MKENLRPFTPPIHSGKPLDDRPGPALPVVPTTHRRLADGRLITFWGSPEMEAAFIRKHTRVTLEKDNAPLPDGEYQLQDGSYLEIEKGRVATFEQRYVSLPDVIVAALVGLFFVFLLSFVANGSI